MILLGSPFLSDWWFCFFAVDLNSPLLFGRLNGLSSDSTIDILYQLGTTQDPGTKDRSVLYIITENSIIKLPNRTCLKCS